ncbi:MAG: competence/damage-inducible protein A [Actinomycetota bacterium]
MRAEVVGVGTELLLGQIANTNAQWISERLAEIGVDVLFHDVVGDNHERIVEVLRLAAGRSEAVIVTGGLGPTQDDITREAIAEVAGVSLVRRPELEDWLRRRFERMGRRMPESNLRQADVPEGAEVIENERGSAPGLVVRMSGATMFALPGVPAEMRQMIRSTVLPRLAAESGPAGIASRQIRSVGMAESRIAEVLDDLFRDSTNPTIAYLAGGGEVRVRLTAKAATLGEADALIAPVAEEVRRRLGDVVYSTGDEELEQVVGRDLKAARKTVACAESLTGGGVAKRLTAAPGASEYFRGAAVVYTAEAKERVLGVSHETIERDGIVSEACAREMAAGARRLFDADVAVSLTGSAGPEPHDGAQPGTVWMALEADDVSHARELRTPGDRATVLRWSEQAALDLLRRYLRGLPLPSGPSLV